MRSLLAPALAGLSLAGCSPAKPPQTVEEPVSLQVESIDLTFGPPRK